MYIRRFFSFATLSVLASCQYPENNKSKDVQTETQSTVKTKTSTKNTVAVSSATTTIRNSTAEKLTILVLPPYDMIANEGISPDIKKYLKSIFTTDTTFRLIQFPNQRLINVPDQNIFDKKYCTQITNKIKPDIIIMSKLDQTTGTGNMATDKWSFRIKIYNTKTGSQKLSNLNANNLTSSEIENLIKSKQQELFSETKNFR
jgi:hypothetical protein